MDKVVFLDRDGTINEEVHYLHRPEDLRILPGVAEGIARLRRAGFRIVVVTNQAGVARGYYGPEDVERLFRSGWSPEEIEDALYLYQDL